MNGLNFKGQFTLVHKDANGNVISKSEHKNIVVNQFLTNALNVLFSGTGTATANSLYIGLYKNGYTPVATDTAATIVASAGEFVNYSESGRVQFVPANTTTQTVTNSASTAIFSFTTTDTLYGLFISTSSGKSSTTGILVSAALFGTPKTVNSGEQLEIIYNITASA